MGVYLTKKNIIDQIYTINTYWSGLRYVKYYNKKWFKRNKTKRIFYSVQDNEIHSYAVITTFHKEPKYVNLGVFGVNPKYLRQKEGTDFLKVLLEKFKNKTMLLNVQENNKRALLFYKKMGFKIVCKHKNYYLMEKNAN